MGLGAALRNKHSSLDSEISEGSCDALNHDQLAERSSCTQPYVVYSIFASLNSIVLGYVIGVISGALIFIEVDLKITEVQEEVFVGVFGVVSILGSLVGGKTSDLFGRKWTLALAALLLQLGLVIMTIAPSFEVLMIGRLFCGVGMGVTATAPVYIAEISPSAARGFLTSFPELFINLGIMFGYVSNYAFSSLATHISWRVMLAVGISPAAFIVFALIKIPESPRWLVMQNRVEEARSVLLKTNGNEGEVEERLEEIQLAARLNNNADKSVLSELLCPSSAVRKMLVVGLGIQVFQQITGIDVVVYYSPKIFKDAGIERNSKLLALTIAVGFIKAAFVFVATLLIDRVGRKPLLYVSSIGMTCCLSVLGFGLALLGKGQVVIALAILCVCGNVAFFSLGIGPISGVLTSEIFPLRLRAQASALAMVVNRLFSGLVAMSFLSLAQYVTVGGTFVIYATLSAISVLFVYILVPETKGKSLEQVEFSFQDQGTRYGSKMEAEHLLSKG